MRLKGKERLTIMIIPHDQERTISLQLNWAIVVFLVGTLLLAGALSIFGLYHKQRRLEELHKLEQLYGANFKAAFELGKQIDNNAENYERLSSSLLRIADSLGMPQEEISLLSGSVNGEMREQALLLRERDWNWHSNSKLRIDYLPPVYALQSLYQLLNDQSLTLQVVHNYLTEGLGVYRSMPMGRPFKRFTGLHDTSGYGPRINPVERGGIELHKGMDTAGPYDSPIYATGSGVVHKVYGWTSGYGRAIIIEHQYGFYSMFAHLARILVRQGSPVKRGQLIATMGNSGRATGPHLHYEIWQGEQIRINPQPMICAIDFKTPLCTRYNQSLAHLLE